MVQRLSPAAQTDLGQTDLKQVDLRLVDLRPVEKTKELIRKKQVRHLERQSHFEAAHWSKLVVVGFAKSKVD